MKNVYFCNKFFIFAMLSLFIYTANYAKSVEFYEIENPHRKSLGEKYKINTDIDDFEDKSPSLIDIKYHHLKKSNNLYNEQKNIEKKLVLYAEENKASKRQRFKQQQEQKANENNESNDSEMLEKKINKSWIDDWLPNISTKPMDMVGAYTSFKLWLAIPMSTSINAKETTSNGTMELFSGKTKYHTMPAFFVAVGNDRFKFWRWEIELGYIPLLSNGISNFSPSSGASDYNFSIVNKDLSMHLMTLSFNNFVQHDFFDKKLVGFAGLGLGLGHAWSMGSKLASEFVMPIVVGHLGISFMVGKKSKMSISYTMLYSQVNISNKYSFVVNNDGRGSHAIRSGSLKFSNLLINGLSIEYLFYTA